MPLTQAESRRVGWVLLLGGLAGLSAAFALILERIALYEDPDHVPACSINPILNCGSVMTTDQAQAFGFPNPLIGIAAFAAAAAAGAIALTGGQLGRAARLALLAGAAGGVLFVHWLIYQSLYVIGALCPYCMGVWIVTIAVFWYVLLDVLAGSRLGCAAARATAMLASYHLVVLTAWYLAITALILVRFWDYWRTLLL